MMRVPVCEDIRRGLTATDCTSDIRGEIATVDSWPRP
jgi:hypothetical protein